MTLFHRKPIILILIYSRPITQKYYKRIRIYHYLTLVNHQNCLMRIIIEVIKTKERYLLLDSQFGNYQNQDTNLFFGNLQSETEQNDINRVIYCCNKHGRIHALNPKLVRVVSIDGQSPSVILK